MYGQMGVVDLRNGEEKRKVKKKIVWIVRSTTQVAIASWCTTHKHTRTHAHTPSGPVRDRPLCLPTTYLHLLGVHACT